MGLFHHVTRCSLLSAFAFAFAVLTLSSRAYCCLPLINTVCSLARFPRSQCRARCLPTPSTMSHLTRSHGPKYLLVCSDELSGRIRGWMGCIMHHTQSDRIWIDTRPLATAAPDRTRGTNDLRVREARALRQTAARHPRTVPALYLICGRLSAMVSSKRRKCGEQ